MGNPQRPMGAIHRSELKTSLEPSRMSDTNMLSPQLEASTETATKERSWDEQGAQRLERQLFFALLGGVLLLVAWLGRFAFGFEQQIADIAATAGAIERDL